MSHIKSSHRVGIIALCIVGFSATSIGTATAAPLPAFEGTTSSVNSAQDPCATNGVAAATSSGVDHKDTEYVAVSDAQVNEINALFLDNGYAPLPGGTAGFLVTDGAEVTIVDAHGNALERKAASVAAPQPQMVSTASVGDKIKRVVGACIGIDFFGAVGAWEAIESQVNSWDKAAKFVLRRVGLIGAITCGGGIFAEYLL